MKKLPSIKALMAIITIGIVIFSANKTDGNKIANNNTIVVNQNYLLASNTNLVRMNYNNPEKVNLLAVNEVEKVDLKEEIPEIVYDGMTLEELAAKLEKNLKSTLTGYGLTFAKASLKYEVDPYLSLAIILHETGCSSGVCSTLARKCNNIGGMKGSPGCGGGSYRKFNTLEQGIEAFYKNLSNNYYKKGLTTPETIGKKYAGSETWPQRVRFYINKIKNS